MLDTETLETIKNASPDDKIVVVYVVVSSAEWQSLPSDVQEVPLDLPRQMEQQSLSPDEIGAFLKEFLQQQAPTKSYQLFCQAFIKARQASSESSDQSGPLPSDATTQSNVIMPSQRPAFGFMKGTGRIHGDIVAPALPESEWEVLQLATVDTNLIAAKWLPTVS